MDIKELKATLKAELETLDNEIAALVKDRDEINAKIKLKRAERVDASRLANAADGRKRAAK